MVVRLGKEYLFGCDCCHGGGHYGPNVILTNVGIDLHANFGQDRGVIQLSDVKE